MPNYNGTMPHIKLTRKETEHLQGIRSFLGKGYVKGYCVKMLHVCPNCGQAKGWINLRTCQNCGHELKNINEYKSLQHRETWLKI